MLSIIDGNWQVTQPHDLLFPSWFYRRGCVGRLGPRHNCAGTVKKDSNSNWSKILNQKLVGLYGKRIRCEFFKTIGSKLPVAAVCTIHRYAGTSSRSDVARLHATVVLRFLSFKPLAFEPHKIVPNFPAFCLCVGILAGYV